MVSIRFHSSNGRSTPIAITLAFQTPLVTLSDPTFGPLIPFGLTFEPRRALLGGPRPSKVVVSRQAVVSKASTRFQIEKQLKSERNVSNRREHGRIADE